LHQIQRNTDAWRCKYSLQANGPYLKNLGCVTSSKKVRARGSEKGVDLRKIQKHGTTRSPYIEYRLAWGLGGRREVRRCRLGEAVVHGGAAGNNQIARLQRGAGYTGGRGLKTLKWRPPRGKMTTPRLRFWRGGRSLAPCENVNVKEILYNINE
jgi:hypothetical protein